MTRSQRPGREEEEEEIRDATYFSLHTIHPIRSPGAKILEKLKDQRKEETSAPLEGHAV